MSHNERKPHKTELKADDLQLRFCEECNCELLILLWIIESSSENDDQVSTPYCESCAKKVAPDRRWMVIQQFTIKKLQTMYDRLKLKL